MKREALLFLLLWSIVVFCIAACGGGGGDDDAPAPSDACAGQCSDITVIAGCGGPAAADTTIWVPKDVDTTQAASMYEPDFVAVGQALKQWVGLYPRQATAGCSAGDPITHNPVRLRVIRASEAETRAWCQAHGSPSDIRACTGIYSSGACVIHISDSYEDQLWGHELWHCVDGNYHP